MIRVKNRETGITLIALVITIIILLILAGVTIAMLTGENGILTKASTAKTETEQAKIEELKKLTQAEANLNLEETTYTDKNGKTVKIPKEMAVSQIDGENEIDKGLVTIDKNGNEWVFIEVPKEIYANTTYNGGVAPTGKEDYLKIESTMQTYAGDYRKSGFIDTWYEGCGLTESEYNTTKSTMLSSVYENGGFYIGRYEVGTERLRIIEEAEQITPIIKQDKYPYNYVTCSEAQYLSKKLSIGEKTSSLMFGVQWDLVCKYIEEKGYLQDDTKVTQEMIKQDSGIWGNYYDITFEITRGKYSIDLGKTFTPVGDLYQKPDNTKISLTTGASERNKVLNIYDFAGNNWEWSLERATTNSNYPCTNRGGYFNNPSSSYSVNVRSNYSLIDVHLRIWFTYSIILEKVDFKSNNM